MKKRKHKSFSSIWMCGLRSASAVITSVLLVVPTNVSAAALTSKQPASCGMAQPLPAVSDGIHPGLGQAHPQPQLTPEQIANRLDKLFSVVAEADREIPRDTFDPQAIINKVGTDPNKIFEWVRDHTYFVPYRGLLRGDKGVLMDRLGNSLDRAMLLYSLLQSVHQPARMAHGTLTEAQAQDLLKKVRPFPSFEQRIGPSWSPTITSTLAKQYAQENQLDLAEIHKQVEKLAAQEKATELKVKNRVATQTAAIAAAVGHPPASVAAEERADQVRAVTDHWWVQWQNGGTWTNLDPTLPASLPGQTLTTSQDTVAPKSYMDVGENLVHTVEINVVIEVWKQGQVKEATALKQKLVPADVIGEPIVLRQVPVHWPQDLNLFLEKDPALTFKKTALAQTEWLPVLSVGSHSFSKYSFNDYGDFNDSTLPGYVQNVMAGRAVVHAEEQGIGRMGQTIGGMLSGHQIAPAPKPAVKPQRAQVTAEWIDYVIQTPGKPAQTIRREIFDLIGPAARDNPGPVPAPQMTDAQKLDRALSLMDTIDILPIVAQLSPEFVVHSSDKNLLSNQAPILGMIRRSGSPGSKDFMGQFGDLKPTFSEQLNDLALMRFRWSKSEVGVYIDRPDLLTFHRLLVMSPKGRLLLEQGLDIVANDVAIAPSSTSDPFRIRLEQGVLDTNAEAALLRPGENITNTARAFAEANNAETKWLTITKDNASALEQADLTKDCRAQAQEDLRGGYNVIVPVGTAHLKGCSGGCWWRIDPTTGQTLGIGNRGWGQTSFEYFIKFSESYVLPVIWGVFTYWGCMGGSGNPIYGNGPLPPRYGEKAALCMACGLAAGILFSATGMAYNFPEEFGSLSPLVPVLTGRSSLWINFGLGALCIYVGGTAHLN